MGCNGCGSSSGNSRLRIVQGETYRLSGLWTHTIKNADGTKTVVPLDVNDWTASLVIRRNLTATTAILELTSDESPSGDITLTQEDDSIRFYVEIPASVTAELPAVKGYRYALTFSDVGDPENVRKPIPAGYVDIKDSA
jgi:hypothetical protein